MKRIRIIAMLAAVMIIIQCVPVNAMGGAFAEEPAAFMSSGLGGEAAETASIPDNFSQFYSGECGDNLTWTLDTVTGLLEITGTGEMTNYVPNSMPWYAYINQIESVVIGEGVTSIGEYAFYNCQKLAYINIPDSVTSIGSDAFFVCRSLTSFTVAPNNEHYSSDAYGVLFNKDKTILINYPAGNTRTSYDIPTGVTTISDNAVRNCISLTTINIPDSVASIGVLAFANSSSLMSIDIPDGVTSIGIQAFSWSHSLTSVNISSSVTFIGDNAFSSCSGMISFTVDPNNEYYSSDTYGVLFNKDKTTLIQYPAGNARTSYEIPNSVISVGSNAFSSCGSLVYINIPVGVTSVGSSAFSGCRSNTSFTVDSNNDYFSNDIHGVLFNKDKTTLINYPAGNARTSYEIPNSVISVGSDAFSSCSNLMDINIPDSVTFIDAYAFFDCRNLESINIPGSVTYIGGQAFSCCNSLTSAYFMGDAPALSGHGHHFSETAPSFTIYYIEGKSGWTSPTWNGYPTATFVPERNIIAEGSCGSNLTWALDDEGLLTIDGTGEMTNYVSNSMPWYAYINQIKSVVIGEGVTSIGVCAFYNCNNMANINIPDSITFIGSNAFYNCYRLTTISIPDGVTSIGTVAFANCSGLTSMNIPASVTSIGNGAFRWCVSLPSFTVDPNNEYYSSDEYGVLFNKDKTILINYPAKSTRPSYEIPTSVTTISDNAFNDCLLTAINIPVGVIYIGINAFSYCNINANFTVDPNNEYYSNDTYGVLFNKDKTTLINYPAGNTRTSYEIPTNVISVNDDAFAACSWLTKINISDSVTSIGYGAFRWCTSLTTIDIPDGVTSIDGNTFDNCSNLNNIFIPESLVRIYGYAFRSCAVLTDVYYRGTQAEWNAIQITPNGNEPLLNATIHYNYTDTPTAPNVDAPVTLTVNPPAGGWSEGVVSFTVSKDDGSKFLCAAALYDGVTHTTLTPVYNADNSVTFTADIIDGITIKVFVQGDVTADGILTAADIDAFRAQIGAGFPGEITAEQLLVSDMNGDGFINTRDLLILREFLGNL